MLFKILVLAFNNCSSPSQQHKVTLPWKLLKGQWLDGTSFTVCGINRTMPGDLRKYSCKSYLGETLTQLTLVETVISWCNKPKPQLVGIAWLPETALKLCWFTTAEIRLTDYSESSSRVWNLSARLKARWIPERSPGLLAWMQCYVNTVAASGKLRPRESKFAS